MIRAIGFSALIIGAVLLGVYTFRQSNTVPSPADRADVLPPVAENARLDTSTAQPTLEEQRAPENPKVYSAAPAVSDTAAPYRVYSQAELAALASDTFASGVIPLGDSRYVTSGPKKGYIYLCNVRKDNAGSRVDGPWISGDTWNFKQKISVDGTISWPQAAFSNTIVGTSRMLSGNNLPISHTTGVFPVQSGTQAAQYDPNPNTISAQVLKESIPAQPVYRDTPQCIGGEVGVMLTGVKLFNGFDAGLRDAAAHELQDSCDGHPQGSGQYHYHSLSSCIKDTGVSTVIGYAYDGFPITGPKVTNTTYLTTDDLDECHGIASEIMLDGKKVTTYHYVMTYDFPYSVGCFRGTSTFTPGGAPQQQGTQPSGMQQSMQGGGQTPPQEAITACSGKSTGSSCQFVSPRGDSITGRCDTPPGSSLACVPER